MLASQLARWVGLIWPEPSRARMSLSNCERRSVLPPVTVMAPSCDLLDEGVRFLPVRSVSAMRPRVKSTSCFISSTLLNEADFCMVKV